MNESRDPYEVLRDLDPVEPTALLGASQSEEAREALERIVATPRDLEKARWRRWVSDVASWSRLMRRHRAIVIVAAMVVTAAVVALVVSLGQRREAKLSVRCYAGVDLHSPIVGASLTSAPPASVCARLWRSRHVGAPTSAAQLQPCWLSSGAVAVFRTSEPRICERLGLRHYSAPHG
jgi:hypothetical protein